MSNDLSKSLYQAVMKAIGSPKSNAHSTKHIVGDILDNNDLPQVPKDHIPVAKEGVLHKDVSVSEIHDQKQANANAALGIAPKMPKGPKMPAMPKAPGMEKSPGNASNFAAGSVGELPPEKGVFKLKKFMEKSMMKKSKNSEKDIKGVHTSGGFSGLEEKGQSQAGRSYERSKEKQPNKYLNQLYEGRAKDMHENKLEELKSMPKPNLPKSEKK